MHFRIQGRRNGLKCAGAKQKKIEFHHRILPNMYNFQKFGHKSAFVKNLQVQGTCSNDDPAFNTNQSLLDRF